jgi:hypothetical protein
LYEECGRSRSSCSIEELLDGFNDRRAPTAGAWLDEASLRVLALRVARKNKLQACALRVAADLATTLLLLTGCPYRRAASQQLWRYCGSTLVRGLTLKDRTVQFHQRTWEFIADHALKATTAFRLSAYASPLAADMPFVVAEELLRDIVTAMTTEDAGRSEFIMSAFNKMSPYRKSGQKLPDVEVLSIWVPGRKE